MSDLEFYKNTFKEFLPDIKEEEVDFFIFECTAYPFGSREHNYNLIKDLCDTLRDGKQPCECCNRPVVKDKSMCQECIYQTKSYEST